MILSGNRAMSGAESPPEGQGAPAEQGHLTSWLRESFSESAEEIKSSRVVAPIQNHVDTIRQQFDMGESTNTNLTIEWDYNRPMSLSKGSTMSFVKTVERGHSSPSSLPCLRTPWPLQILILLLRLMLESNLYIGF